MIYYTQYNRYRIVPNYFEEIRKITGDSIDILSLGCSTGEEFKNALISVLEHF